MYESRHILNWFQFCCLYELCVFGVDGEFYVSGKRLFKGFCADVVGKRRKEVCLRLVI